MLDISAKPAHKFVFTLNYATTRPLTRNLNCPVLAATCPQLLPGLVIKGLQNKQINHVLQDKETNNV